MEQDFSVDKTTINSLFGVGFITLPTSFST